jgi:enoyl-CoA hydratase/carnithine racemase
VTRAGTPDDDAADTLADSTDELLLRIKVAGPDELRALRGALLAARTTELSEVQRRSQRHSLGYGTDSQRDAMTDEVADRRRRWEMLDRLLTAVEEASRAAG